MSGKILTEAEKQELMTLVQANQQTYANFQRFLGFLRVQHDAPEDAGWQLLPDGSAFVREGAPPAPTPSTRQQRRQQKQAQAQQ